MELLTSIREAIQPVREYFDCEMYSCNGVVVTEDELLDHLINFIMEVNSLKYNVCKLIIATKGNRVYTVTAATDTKDVLLCVIIPLI